MLFSSKKKDNEIMTIRLKVYILLNSMIFMELKKINCFRDIAIHSNFRTKY